MMLEKALHATLIALKRSVVMVRITQHQERPVTMATQTTQTRVQTYVSSLHAVTRSYNQVRRAMMAMVWVEMDVMRTV
jgi:hypothetical protein